MDVMQGCMMMLRTYVLGKFINIENGICIALLYIISLWVVASCFVVPDNNFFVHCVLRIATSLVISQLKNLLKERSSYQILVSDWAKELHAL